MAVIQKCIKSLHSMISTCIVLQERPPCLAATTPQILQHACFGFQKPHFFGFSTGILAENAETIKFALCVELTLPNFS